MPILSASLLLLLLHHQCVCIESQYLNNDSKDTHHHHHHHAVNAAVSIKPHRYTPTHPFIHLPLDLAAAAAMAKGTHFSEDPPQVMNQADLDRANEKLAQDHHSDKTSEDEIAAR